MLKIKYKQIIIIIKHHHHHHIMYIYIVLWWWQHVTTYTILYMIYIYIIYIYIFYIYIYIYLQLPCMQNFGLWILGYVNMILSDTKCIWFMCGEHFRFEDYIICIDQWSMVYSISVMDDDHMRSGGTCWTFGPLPVGPSMDERNCKKRLRFAEINSKSQIRMCLWRQKCSSPTRIQIYVT
jgi:hypothetical protein